MVAVKREIRDREILDADVVIDDEKLVKQVDLANDAFFASDSDDVVVEKRPVMRDGRVPKLAKNYEKIYREKIERQRIQEGWYEDVAPVEQKIAFREESTIKQKPLKIKASSFGKDVAAENNRRIINPEQTEKLNVKFWVINHLRFLDPVVA